jgi:hypothetical protein
VRGLTKFLQLNNLSSQRVVCCDDKARTIVVDGNGFVYWLFMKYNLVPSADYTRVHQIVLNFLQTFLKLNIRLVFVFDGPTEIRKIQCKLERLSNQAAESWKSLTQGNSNALPLPSLAFESILECLRENCSFIDSEGGAISNGALSHLCLLCSGEADKEIIKTAIRMGACGIMSNDSDMIIYNTSAISFIPLWSVEWSTELSQVHFSAVERETVAAAFLLPPQVQCLTCEFPDFVLGSVADRRPSWS